MTGTRALAAVVVLLAGYALYIRLTWDSAWGARIAPDGQNGAATR